jgi:hypothetical protein
MRIFLASIFLSVSMVANAETVDFEDLAAYAVNNYFSSVPSNDYEFSDGIGAVLVNGPIADKSIAFCTEYNSQCPGNYLTMTNQSGKLFDLHSIDVEFYSSNLSGAGFDTIEVTGFLGAGGSVITTFTFETGLSVPETLTFGNEWLGLTSIELSAGPTFSSLALDNFVVTTVPIPAAVWLFGSALAGLGWLRRKQTI